MKIYKESLEAMLRIVRDYTQQTTDMEIERRVYDIIADVRTNGDAALKAYSEKHHWNTFFKKGQPHKVGCPFGFF